MIPVFEAVIEGLDDGIYRISLVDLPAVESDFVYFGEQSKEIKLSIDNEEQRLVTGVIMRADFPIYRYDDNFGEYYIKYSKETIKRMAEKMMSDNTFNNVNLMHLDGSDVEGVNLVELFIKDTAKGISPSKFRAIEDGSLFATYKINNDEIWEQIKNGSFRGFSLEGIFDVVPVKARKQDKYNILTYMGKLFNKFMKSFVKFGSVTTDKGELYWVGEADLAIGDELFYDKGDDIIKVEDGEYTLEDGTVIVVKEGLVSEIREKDGEQEGELDMAEDEDEKKVECEEEEVVIEEPVEEDTKYDDLKRDIDALRAEHDELKGIVEEVVKTLDSLLEKPAAEPIVEEFEKVAKLHTNDAKLNNALNVIGSLKRKK